MDDRRKFERVMMPRSSTVKALSDQGQELGPVTMIGRGGFQVKCGRAFAIGDSARVTIVDASEDIRRDVKAVCRNVSQDNLVGFEFKGLDADAAVEIGVLIGKYYAAGAGANL